MSHGITLLEVPVRTRILPLYCLRGNVDGYLFWSLNFYEPEKVQGFPEKPWPVYRDLSGVAADGGDFVPPWHKENPWQVPETVGDGIMLFPPEAGSTEPMPCQRMMLWRSGMEDLEYLVELRRLLREKGGKLAAAEAAEAEALLNLDALLEEAWETPEMTDELRAKAGEFINRLRKL
jgi:hypothetical protein